MGPGSLNLVHCGRCLKCHEAVTLVLVAVLSYNVEAPCHFSKLLKVPLHSSAASICVHIAHEQRPEGLILGNPGLLPVTTRDSLVPPSLFLVLSSLGLRFSLGGFLGVLGWNGVDAPAPKGGVATAADLWFSL